jgi:hypothetical protein
MISISPSMYGEVIKVIFKTVMDWDQICQMGSNLLGNKNAQSDWYNSIFSDLLSKLLVNYPQYRFPCCTAIWDMIQHCQVQFNDTNVQLNNTKMALNKAKMMQKKGTKVNLSQYETKMVNLTQELAKINTKTSHLAKVIGDLISQPLTLDFYVLRKMAFTPMMYVMMMDEKEQEINENGENGENGQNGQNGEKNSLFKIFDNIVIKKDDINSMNDNTIVFFHTFCEQICKKLANLNDSEIEERLKDMVAPLQGQNITNYLTMDKDILRLRYTKFSKYEQVRQKAKVVKKNFDGMRILSCLSEAMKQIALPMIIMNVIDAQDDKNKGLDVVKRVQMVAEMFFKVLNTDNVVRK